METRMSRAFKKLLILTLFLDVSCGLQNSRSRPPASGQQPSKSLTEVANRSTIARVPHRAQEGPTCGLYALGMVMDYWHAVNSASPTYLVRSADLSHRGIRYHYNPTSNEKILDYVITTGKSIAGEMFSARFMADTAIHFSYRANLYLNVTSSELYRILDQGRPAIVAFDVRDDGNPTLSQGQRAHYAVIEGYFVHMGIEYVVAKHGWDQSADYIWTTESLFDSMRNLEFTYAYVNTFNRLPTFLSLPQYQNGPHHDIRSTLAATIVEVFP